jgi:hypothetical protein
MINWSNWEDAGNGLSLKTTPPGRYLQVEAVLEIIKGLNSPVIYDISVNALNTTSEATDLAVNITGNASSLGIGDTVHLVISLSNLGPNKSDAKLNYKIPVGLKLLSSQGPGVYDAVSGVWNAGLLLVNDSVSLDLVLQVLGAGCFNHVVDVYDSLNVSNNHMVWSMVCASVLGDISPTVIDSSAFNGLKPINNGGSGSGSGGSGNGGNGGGSGGSGGSGNGGNGGGSGGSGGSGGNGGGNGGSITPDNTPKTQLQRDIRYIRDFMSYTPTDNSQDDGGQNDKKPNEPPKMPDWNPDQDKPKNEKVEEKDYTVMLTLGVITATVAVAFMKTKSQKFGKMLKKLGIKYKNPPKNMKELFSWLSSELSISDFIEDPHDPLAYIFFALSSLDLLGYISNEQIGMTIAAIGFGITAMGWAEDYFGVDIGEIINPTERVPLNPYT